GERVPWRGCTDTRVTLETRSEWIALLDGARETARLLSEGSLRYARILGLPPPRTLGDYEWLKEVSNLISATPRPPRAWFEDVDLDEIEAEAEGNRRAWDEYWSSRRALERFYDDRFFDLPQGTERVERALNRVAALMTPASKGDGGLLKQMRDLASYVETLQRKVEEWKKEADDLSRMLGLAADAETIGGVQRLAELAVLCERKERPEAQWLSRRTLRVTVQLFEEARGDHERREDLKRRLLGEYHEDLLALDLGRLMEWFDGPGRSAFRYLRPSHYRIRGLISRVNRRGRVPDTVLEDLAAARELLALEGRMASRREALRRSFRSYYREDGLDFASTERALRIAEKALKIVGGARAPRELVENLSAGTVPDERLLRLGRKLRASLSEWASSTRSLRGLIPTRRLPTTGRSLRSSPLHGVADWAREVAEGLATLSNVAGEALAARRSDHPSSFTELLSDLKELERLKGFEAEVERRSEGLRSLFGGLFTGLTTDWEAVLASIGWVRRLRRLLRDGVPHALAQAASEEAPSPPRVPEVGPRLERLHRYLDAIDERFEGPLWAEERRLLELEDVERRLGALRSRVDDLQTWTDFKDLVGRLREAGLGGFVASLVRRGFDRERLLDIFRKSMYQGLLDLIYEEDPVLREFRALDHEQLIADFQELDRRFIRLSAQRVIEIANEQKPQGVFVQAQDSEITVLQREAVKKRRHMPLRHLFDRIPNLLRRLKPCLMMSPLSVSQFRIPGRLHFDLVIFDEASQ
ncbi:MAG: hypothetical protein ACE5OO_06020, partial [Candidatus Bathyarchaeia archaeon]